MGSNSGKVGTVVAYKWKGKDVLRGYKRYIANPRTPAQQLHRAKFRAISLLASDLLKIIKRGFKELSDRQSSTETGLFVKSNWPIVASNEEGEIDIPLHLLVVSKGDLPGVVFGEPQTAAVGQRSAISVEFTSPDADGTDGDDSVYLGLYCPARNRSELSAPVKRQDGRVLTDVPEEMVGEEVHLYGFAVGSDFNGEHRYEASDSCWLGAVVV